MRRLGDLCDLIRNRTGINLVDVRDLGSLERFVRARVNALGLDDEDAYLERLRALEPYGPELAHLITAVTNPHTFFFRDAAQFQAARTLLEERRSSGASRPIRIWSAGCSTGEEPFTIAMLARDIGVPAQIVATDINEDVLTFAREGLYRSWSLRRCPEPFIERFFERVDEETYRVGEELRQLVVFRRHNLVLDSFLSPGVGERWDWIFCRNVLLYFDRELTERLIGRFAEVLDPEGWLFLSTAEHLYGIQTTFRVVGVGSSFAYRPGGARPAERGEEQRLEAARERTTWPPAVEAWRLERLSLSGAGHDVEVEERQPQPVASAVSNGRYGGALEAAERGDIALARDLLTSHLEAQPDDRLAWITRGNFCLRLHDFEGALADYERARELDPLLAEVHYLNGVVYRKLGDLPRAIHCFRQALFLEPGHWGASFLLAGLYDRVGDSLQYRRNLALALSLLEAGRPLPRFISHVEGMRDVLLEPAETLRLCRRYLVAISAHPS